MVQFFFPDYFFCQITCTIDIGIIQWIYFLKKEKKKNTKQRKKWKDTGFNPNSIKIQIWIPFSFYTLSLLPIYP